MQDLHGRADCGNDFQSAKINRFDAPHRRQNGFTERKSTLGDHMNKTTTILLSFALMAFASTSNAQEETTSGYVGANHAFLTYEEDGFDPEFDLGAIVGKAGAKFNPYLAAELRLGVGISSDSVTTNGVFVEVDLDNFVGGYALVGIPNESPIYPYVAVGFTQGNVSYFANGPGGTFKESESESDNSFGFGADLELNESAYLNAEYMNYFDKDGVQISGFSFGAKLMF